MNHPVRIVLFLAVLSGGVVVNESQACGLFYYWKWCRYQALKQHFEGYSTTAAPSYAANRPQGLVPGGSGGNPPVPSPATPGPSQPAPGATPGRPGEVSSVRESGSPSVFVSLLQENSWEQNIAALQQSIQQLQGLNQLHRDVAELKGEVKTVSDSLTKLNDRVEQMDKNIQTVLELLKGRGAANQPAP
jgi:hypothetical protein